MRPASALMPTRIWFIGCGSAGLMDATSKAGACASSADTENARASMVFMLVLRGHLLGLLHYQKIDRRFARVQFQAQLLHGREHRGLRMAVPLGTFSGPHPAAGHFLHAD